MNILFDLVHPADLNLFKPSIDKLKQDNHNVIITLRKRGALQRITENELPDFEILAVGSHKKNLPGKIMASANLNFIPPDKYTIIIGCYDNNSYCLDMEDGRQLWVYKTGNFINGKPAIANEKIIIGGCDNFIHIISAKTGRKISGNA